MLALTESEMPELSVGFAKVILFFNIIIPGSGTIMISCSSHSQDGCLSIFAKGVLQLFFSGMIIGWVFSITTGLYCLKKAQKHAEEEEEKAKIEKEMHQEEQINDGENQIKLVQRDLAECNVNKENLIKQLNNTQDEEKQHNYAMEIGDIEIKIVELKAQEQNLKILVNQIRDTKIEKSRKTLMTELNEQRKTIKIDSKDPIFDVITGNRTEQQKRNNNGARIGKLEEQRKTEAKKILEKYKYSPPAPDKQ